MGLGLISTHASRAVWLAVDYGYVCGCLRLRDMCTQLSGWSNTATRRPRDTAWILIVSDHIGIRASATIQPERDAVGAFSFSSR